MKTGKTKIKRESMHAHSHMVNLEIYMMCLQFRLSAVHVVSMGGIGRKSPSVSVVASSLLGVLSQQGCSVCCSSSSHNLIGFISPVIT